MSTYKDWISELDLRIDYYSAFIKAWIAFNSWYRSEYSEKTDKEIIEKIKNTNNVFKNTIETFLDTTNRSEKSKSFTIELEELRNALVESSIMTQERAQTREAISFSNIAIANPKTFFEGNYRSTHYRIERKGTTIKTVITKKSDSTKILFSFEQLGYNENELDAHIDFKKLSNEQQGQCKAFYKEISPFVSENIVILKQNGQYEFVKDKSKVSRGIIEVLYLLRCSLMHGEVNPSKKAMQVYKHAYELLLLILTDFK